MRLEDLTKGVLPNQQITVIDAQWDGSDVVTFTYRDTKGVTGNELIFRDCAKRTGTANRPKGSGQANRSLGTFVSQAGVRTLNDM